MTKENTQESTDVLDLQAELRAQLAAAKEAVAPPSGFSISVKGKQFTLPDGSVNPGPMNAVILDWVTLNMYYSGAYNANQPEGPKCFALGRKLAELSPPEDVPTRQNDTCSGCAMNEWESAPGGGKGKACKNTRRLLVVGSTDIGEGTQPYILPVSPTGLSHFDKYVTSLVDRGLNPIEVVTEISFDANAAYPSLRFKPLDKHDVVEVAFNLKASGQSILTALPQVDRAA
jgi:hypothetical protein